MIAAVATVFNEEDIIDRTLLHLFYEGVDHVYLADASTDGTAKVDAYVGCTVIRDEEPFHFQPKWINHLAALAAADGHEWIIPFDADEFWYAVDAPTIRKALHGLPDEIRCVHARSYQMVDWDHREVEYRSMGKVAYRWEPNAWVANGNHSVYLPSGGQQADGVLALREFQFRSFEHLQRKCHERVDRIDPSLPYTEGTHQRVLAELDETELLARWNEMQATPSVYDPIPTNVPKFIWDAK